MSSPELGVGIRSAMWISAFGAVDISQRWAVG